MSIVKNYGFLWERRFIYRGVGGAPGHLQGKRSGGNVVDFRDQIGIYVLYDRNQSIVYVGKAGDGNSNLLKRLVQHMDDDLWNRWEFFSWVGFRSVTQQNKLNEKHNANTSVKLTYSTALRHIEAVLIKMIEPKLNKHAGAFGGAVEYDQDVDQRVAEITNNNLQQYISDMERRIIKHFSGN